MFGVGPDGVGGTADDTDVDFGDDVLNPNEGFTGTEDTLTRTAFGLSRDGGSRRPDAPSSLAPAHLRPVPGGGVARATGGGVCSRRVASGGLVVDETVGVELGQLHPEPGPGGTWSSPTTSPISCSLATTSPRS